MAKIRVEQKDGSITLAYQGNEPKTYNVTDHLVTVPAGEVAVFLDSVAGSSPADDAAKKIDAQTDPSAPALPAT